MAMNETTIRRHVGKEYVTAEWLARRLDMEVAMVLCVLREPPYRKSLMNSRGRDVYYNGEHISRLRDAWNMFRHVCSLKY